MKNIAIIRYPGSNCDIETMKYFSFGGNKCFYLWHETHKIDYIDIEKVDLIVIPGGFAFGDRIYDKATNSYEMSPGTMAIKCGKCAKDQWRTNDISKNYTRQNSMAYCIAH